MAKFSRTRAYQLIRDDLNPSAFVLWLSLPTSHRPPNPVIIETLNHWRRVTHENLMEAIPTLMLWLVLFSEAGNAQ